MVMRAKLLVKMTVLLALLAGISTAGVKYVAVVETEVDAQSGAASNLNPAEVRQITAELRRVAVANLPRSAYNIMTSETVMAQGGAVLEECADENCVITLGSKIGADYIVRGTISKFQTMLTLSVEVYETENGTLVASSDPVRSENPAELLGLAATACANMYKTWARPPRMPEPTQVKRNETKNYIGANKTILRSSLPTVDLFSATEWAFIEWAEIEFGWSKNNGVFFGFEFGGGFGDEDLDTNGNGFNRGRIGGGLNVGYTFKLPASFYLSVGGSVGFWYEGYNKYIIVTPDPTNYHAIETNLECVEFGGPFIRARWKFIEISYRGFIGYLGNSRYHIMYSQTTEYDYNYVGLAYINQFKAGLHIEF